MILSPFTFVSIIAIDNNCTCNPQKLLCFISFLAIQVLKDPKDPRHRQTIQLCSRLRKTSIKVWVRQNKTNKYNNATRMLNYLQECSTTYSNCVMKNQYPFLGPYFNVLFQSIRLKEHYKIIALAINL